MANTRNAKKTQDKPLAALEHLEERGQFRALLLANPNYFGNLKKSAFEPVLEVLNNTFYEEIGCVGFQPQFDRLEAVIYVKQAFGYSGDICSKGSPEYVRFFVSYDEGTTWQDLGLTSFTAYDIPDDTEGRKRLEYAVSLEFHPSRQLCLRPKRAKVRAILSWNDPPPAGNPEHDPVWGQRHDTYIQIEPIKFLPWWEFLQEAKVKLPNPFAELADLTQPVSLAKPKALGALELNRLYEGKVEPHRFAFKELAQLVEGSSKTLSLQATSLLELLPGIEIDPDILSKLFGGQGDGNTSYEELECVGYNPNLDTLSGVIRVKKPSGYSGGPCTDGSQEYVSFWADLNNNGIFETYLGTTSVTVYDFGETSKEGLEYAIFLPVNLSNYRKPCQEGPVVIAIRAILSWNVPVLNPDKTPVWGNREETLVHVRPGQVVHPDDHAPIIQTVGSMDVDDISAITGLATGPAALAGFTAQDSPFGGEVILTGHIANAPDISNGAVALKYKVEVSPDGGASWQTLGNNFMLGRDQLLNGVWSNLLAVNQVADPIGPFTGFYTYQEDLANGFGNAQIFPVGNVLARWQTSGLTGTWLIRINVKNPANPIPTWVSNVVTVRIDSEAPNGGLADPNRPFLSITSGGGACADFTVGDVISGNYEVRDEHLGSLSLVVEPTQGGSFTSPAPLPPGGTMPLLRHYIAGLPTGGEVGAWLLDTSGMPRCGYIIRLSASDRTIVNSGFVGRSNDQVVGFCLREKGT
jgi:hypothetical protein